MLFIETDMKLLDCALIQSEWLVTEEEKRQANKIFLTTIKQGLLWAAGDCIIHDFLWPAIDQPVLSAWAFG